VTSIETLLARPALQTLGWTLIHFIWQGAIVAFLVYVSRALLSRAQATVRYGSACAGMLLLLILPVLTSCILSRADGTATGQAAGTQVREIARDIQSQPVSIAPDSAAFVYERGDPASPAQAFPLRQWVADRFGLILPWLILFWAAGVLGLSIRFFGGLRFSRRLIRKSAWPLDEWRQSLDGLSRRLRISRPVRLCQSALVQVPTVIGWLKPVILIPASALTGLSSEQIEALLAHELAHIRRHDYLINVLQTVVENLLFYHPAVWWISKQVRLERENCCDDIAVGACGNVLTYARALADLELLRSARPPLAVAATGGSLLDRIERLLGRSRPASHQFAPQWSVLLGGAIAIITVVSFVAGPKGSITTADAAPSSSGMPAISAATGMVTHTSPIELQPPTDQATRVDPSQDRSGRSTVGQSHDLDQDSSSAGHGFRGEGSIGEGSVDERSIENQEKHSDTGDYIGELQALGLKNLTVEQLIALRTQGVTPGYVRAMKELGYDSLTVRQLIALRVQGVTPEYVKRFEERGFPRLTVEELISLRIQGVAPEAAAEFEKLGMGKLPAKALLSLRIQGVTPEYVKELADIGYSGLTASQLISLRIQGVRPAGIRAFKDVGYANLSVKELISMAIQGVSPAYIKEMKSCGLEHLDVAELVSLRIQGVAPELVRGMKNLGYVDLSARKLIALAVQGIGPDYIKQMKDLGFDHISLDQLISLRIHGITGDYIRELNAQGYPKISADQLIRLSVHGITAKYIEELRSAGYSGLSLDQLVRLKIHGITAEFIKSILAHGFKNLSVDQLIQLRNIGIH
jgi:beta-lactamase regulating signal transducer with metallopeptidase domain